MKLILDNIIHQLGANKFKYNATITSSITGVYGPSGAGKSTLLNILCGIADPKIGRIEFNGIQLYNGADKVNVPINKRNIGVVFQDNYLFPHLNIKQNLLYSQAYNKNKEIYINLDKVVELLQIEVLLNKKPAQISGGERQRVAIGRALLSQPKLLLFDEPFSNLDRNRRKEIISYLLKINHRFKIPLLIVSHDLEDILKLTNSILVIDKGEILVCGNYVDIADSGEAPNIISHKRFLNVFDVHSFGYDSMHKLYKFGKTSDSNKFLFTNSDLLSNPSNIGQQIRLCISPDDIALSTKQIPDTSIQNHLKGKIIKLIELGKSIFVTVDCGFLLVAEISIPAYEKLKIKFGDEIFCLIKAKAVEVVHVFKQSSNEIVNRNM
jgi:molybdate transport system ATP-binding protein